jgi:hypothetical protein
MVLSPHQCRDQQVERRHLGAPGQLAAFFQPLGVLIEHRVDDMDERLVAVDQAVPAALQVAFEPAFNGVLAQHLHDPAFGSELGAVGVLGKIFGEPQLLGNVVERLQPVRLRLVRAEDAEVAHVEPRHVAQEVDELLISSCWSGGRKRVDSKTTAPRGHSCAPRHRRPSAAAVFDGDRGHCPFSN